MNPFAILCIPSLLVLSTEIRAADVSQYEDLLRRHITLGQDSATLLSRVTSKETAEENSSALQAISLRFAEISKAMNELAEIPEVHRSSLLKKYELPLRTTWGEVYKEIYRIQKAQSYGSNLFVKEFQVYCQLLNQ